MPRVTLTRGPLTRMRAMTQDQLDQHLADDWTVVGDPEPTPAELATAQREQDTAYNALVDELVDRGTLPSERASALKRGQGSDSSKE